VEQPTSCVSSAMPSPWATRRTSIPLRQALLDA
jgi:hypothetical protein